MKNKSDRRHFIETKIIPRLMTRIEEESDGEHSDHGVLIAELKKIMETTKGTESTERLVFEPPIKWREIENALKERDIEVHRVCRDDSDDYDSSHSANSLQRVYRTMRRRSKSKSKTISKVSVSMKKGKLVDRGLNEQIYRMIHGSGSEGILSSELYRNLKLTTKQGHKRLTGCCRIYDLKMVPEYNGKTLCHRLFVEKQGGGSGDGSTVNKSKSTVNTTITMTANGMKNGKTTTKTKTKKKTPISSPSPRDGATKIRKRRTKAQFNRRKQRLQDFLNDRDGVVTMKEARRYLQEKEENRKGDGLLLDSKSFNRLTKPLVTKKVIQIIHYNMAHEITRKMQTHSVLLRHEMNGKDPAVIEKVKNAIQRTREMQNESSLITKVSNQEMDRKLTKITKLTQQKKNKVDPLKSEKSKSRKRKFNAISNDNTSRESTVSQRPLKKSRTDSMETSITSSSMEISKEISLEKDNDQRVYRRVDWCPFYGYIRPIMSRVRLLHEFLCQFKRNEQMELVDDIEYDENTGLIMSPPPPREPSLSTRVSSSGSTHSVHSVGSTSFDLDHIHSEAFADFALSATTSPYHEVRSGHRLRYHEGLVFEASKGMAPLPTQDDQLHHRSKFDLPLRHRVNQWMTAQGVQQNNNNSIPNISTKKRIKNTMRHCAFKNLMKTFPLKLFAQIIGVDVMVPGIEDHRLWNVRICNLPPMTYHALMAIDDCRTMRLCQLMAMLKKLELITFVKNPYFSMTAHDNHDHGDDHDHNHGDDGDCVHHKEEGDQNDAESKDTFNVDMHSLARLSRFQPVSSSHSHSHCCNHNGNHHETTNNAEGNESSSVIVKEESDGDTAMLQCDGCDTQCTFKAMGWTKGMRAFLSSFYCTECIKNKKGKTRYRCDMEKCYKPMKKIRDFAKESTLIKHFQKNLGSKSHKKSRFKEVFQMKKCSKKGCNELVSTKGVAEDEMKTLKCSKCCDPEKGEKASSALPATKSKKKSLTSSGPGSKPKDPNAPKRPMNAYMLFQRDNRAIIKSENVGKKPPEIIKLCAARWKEMKLEEKRPYELRAGELKKKHKEEVTKYEKTKEWKEYQQRLREWKKAGGGVKSTANKKKTGGAKKVKKVIEYGPPRLEIVDLGFVRMQYPADKYGTICVSFI